VVDWADFPRLKWRAFAVVAAAIVALLCAAHLVFSSDHTWTPVLVRAGMVLTGMLAFNEYVFRLVGRAEAALQQERRRLQAIHQISSGVAFLPALERNLGSSLEVIRAVFGAAVVAWMVPAGGELQCRLIVGERRTGADDDLRLRYGQDLPGRALSCARTVVLEDFARVPAGDRAAYPLMAAEGLRSAVALPAAVHQSVLGVLVVGWRAAHRLGGADRDFLENVGNLVAVAVQNLRLYRETQRLAGLEERERLAREMHDGLAQALTYLKLKAEAALTHAQSPSGLPLVAAALEAMRRGAVDALMDLKSPAAGTPGDFTAHLAAYLHTWTRLNDIETELLLPQGAVHLQEDAEFQVLRIVQEALANVRKHAAARRVWVRLAREVGIVTVTVADDGRGFDPGLAGRPGHFGLGILRERATAIGGSVTVGPRAGGGTEVVLRVPDAVQPAGGLAVGLGGSAR
jgi:two-component system nitrate/nitrite sensor histidine kinase NarX